ncbi:MAG TPA: zeta toxin family protein [Planctomycetota bacterium]|nr:zeta toxin family protein [Planctomycetota bacterium]
MLERLHDLAERRADFAFESTLASRSFAPWIANLCREDGYRFHLVFIWLRTPGIAIARVKARSRLGGHDIPPDVIDRRYTRAVRNFFELYAPLAWTWRFYDNSDARRKLLATGGLARAERAYDAKAWTEIKKTHAQDG